MVSEATVWTHFAILADDLGVHCRCGKWVYTDKQVGLSYCLSYAHRVDTLWEVDLL
jgi:hypothetical protein